MQLVPISIKSANNTSVSVQTTSTKILDDNSARSGIVIVNDSANVVYLALVSKTGDADAVVNQGIRLNANGGALQFDFNATWKGAVYGIAVGGASNVTVCELL